MKNIKPWYLLAGLLLVGGLIYLLGPILTPFLIAAFLAYITNPLVDYLVRLKLPRTAAVIIVFSTLLLTFILFLVLLIPILQHQVVILIEQIPIIFSWVQTQVIPWISQQFGVQVLFNIESVKDILIKNWQTAGNVADILIKTVTNSGYSLIVFMINLVLIPVVTFYLLRDWNDLLKGVRRLFPRSIEPTAMKLIRECNEVLGAFLRGQFLVMLSLSVFYSFGLWVIGLKLALLLGLVIGFTSIVPYLGTIIGFCTGIIAVLVQFPDSWHFVYLAIVFMSGHILESMILTPLLVGDRIGLHPVAVIFAILAGGQLFGFIGILLALPIAAITMVLVRHLHQRYLHSKVYVAK